MNDRRPSYVIIDHQSVKLSLKDCRHFLPILCSTVPVKLSNTQKSYFQGKEIKSLKRVFKIKVSRQSQYKAAMIDG